MLKLSRDLKQILGPGLFDNVLSDDFGRNVFETLLHSQIHSSGRGLASRRIFLKQPYCQPDTLKTSGLINITKPNRVDQCPLSLFGGPE